MTSAAAKIDKGASRAVIARVTLPRATLNDGEYREARALFWRGWSLRQISEELSLVPSTISSWKNRDKWEAAPSHQRIESSLEARYCALIEKDEKSGRDFKEIDLLGRQLEKMARIEVYRESRNEADLNPKIRKRNSPEAKAKGKATRDEKAKNCLTDEQWDLLEADFHACNFGHQKTWWEKRNERQRKIKKSRQIGATWYFAREGMMKARESSLEGHPRNQIFLSASKRQSLIFRRYIVAWVRKITGVQLKGGLGDGPLILDMGDGHEPVEMHYLSTSSATAQGEHGDFYFDEFFWVPGFTELNHVASAMATHKIYKKTYFSSASTVTHQAFPFWNGDEWNKGRSREEQCKFDMSTANLAVGKVMPDGSWCQSVTIHAAISQGMGCLLDADELLLEKGADKFRNLYECEEIDDTESSFPFSALSSCLVDSFLKWKDYEALEARPFGDEPVWFGYDPDKGGRDGASLTVIAPPKTPKGKFRLLEKISLKGHDFEAQNKAIKRCAGRYNVVDIGIDTSGAGQAVWELVVKWHPTARRIDYTISSKAALVMKMQNVIRNRRFQYDAGWHDVTAAFIAIRPTITAGGGRVTYTAGRSTKHGHADVAWSVMHAIINEPMDASEAGQKKSSVEFM